MIRINVFKANDIELIKKEMGDFVILPVGYVLTNETLIDDQLEDVFNLLNWSCWREIKPENVYSPIDHCASGIILNIAESTDFYLSMSIGWKKFNSFLELFSWFKDNWNNPKTMFKDKNLGIKKMLKSYIEEQILPMYKNHDEGHKIDHANYVIERSLKLAELYNLDINKCYVIAAYHDIGLGFTDREHHHLESGKFVREDISLKSWFNTSDIELIAQACEDHRASLIGQPRSMYGCVVSDADRDDNIKTMIFRSFSYNKKLYPIVNVEDTLNNVFAHLQEKYGKGGYGALKLDKSYDLGNGEALEIQRILEDKNEFDKIVSKMRL